MTEQEPGYFLQHRPHQPKREVCAYLATHGFDVPRIFENLDEARRSKLPFIIRSEHPQDLDGISGVRDSIVVDKPNGKAMEQYLSEELIRMRCDKFHNQWLPHILISEQARILRQQFIETLMRGTSKTSCSDFSRMQNIDPSEFDEETSYSYWEYVPGINRQMVADSAIEGRYHLLSRGENTHGYAVVDRASVRHFAERNAEKDLTASCIQRLVETYEGVRSLLGPDHCLLLEIQSMQEEARDYILQALYTRKFDPPSFSISRVPDGAIPADFVRGKTPENGEECRLRCFSLRNLPTNKVPVDAAFDFHYREVLLGAQLPYRKVHCMGSDFDIDFHLLKASVRHFNAMQLFSPAATFVVPYPSLLQKEEVRKLLNDGNLALPVRFVIDGTRGYVERLGDIAAYPLEGYQPEDPELLKIFRRDKTNLSAPVEHVPPLYKQLMLFEKALDTVPPQHSN